MSNKKNSLESWLHRTWRPSMGWMYMGICILDFAVFPILWSLLQVMLHVPVLPWEPLTIKSGGLFHLAMGAVLGTYAYGRTQEKLQSGREFGFPRFPRMNNMNDEYEYDDDESLGNKYRSRKIIRRSSLNVDDDGDDDSVEVGYAGKLKPIQNKPNDPI